jgi:hypothetical protein
VAETPSGRDQAHAGASAAVCGPRRSSAAAAGEAARAGGAEGVHEGQIGAPTGQAATGPAARIRCPPPLLRPDAEAAAARNWTAADHRRARGNRQHRACVRPCGRTRGLIPPQGPAARAGSAHCMRRRRRPHAAGKPAAAVSAAGRSGMAPGSRRGIASAAPASGVRRTPSPAARASQEKSGSTNVPAAASAAGACRHGAQRAGRRPRAARRWKASHSPAAGEAARGPRRAAPVIGSRARRAPRRVRLWSPRARARVNAQVHRSRGGCLYQYTVVGRARADAAGMRRRPPGVVVTVTSVPIRSDKAGPGIDRAGHRPGQASTGPGIDRYPCGFSRRSDTAPHWDHIMA